MYILKFCAFLKLEVLFNLNVVVNVVYVIVTTSLYIIYISSMGILYFKSFRICAVALCRHREIGPSKWGFKKSNFMPFVSRNC